MALTGPGPGGGPDMAIVFLLCFAGARTAARPRCRERTGLLAHRGPGTGSGGRFGSAGGSDDASTRRKGIRGIIVACEACQGVTEAGRMRSEDGGEVAAVAGERQAVAGQVQYRAQAQTSSFIAAIDRSNRRRIAF